MKLKLSLIIGDMRLECDLEGDTIEKLKDMVPEVLDTAARQIEMFKRFKEQDSAI